MTFCMHTDRGYIRSESSSEAQVQQHKQAENVGRATIASVETRQERFGFDDEDA